ncbi:MAG: hypothetical protein PVH19_00395 [Planctomycetia bacterium]|jgi:hypothetical protein
MNRNELQIEELLAEVQLRRPELDVETLLRKAAEPEGVADLRRQVQQVRRKRCFCRWATFAGIWASGLAIGVLIMYLYTSGSLQEVQSELEDVRAQLVRQDRPVEPDSLPSVSPSPSDVPSSAGSDILCKNEQPAWSGDLNRWLTRLLGPNGHDDKPLYAMSYVVSSKQRACYKTGPSFSHEDEPEATCPTTGPDESASPKTRQELFEELLEQVS